MGKKKPNPELPKHLNGIRLNRFLARAGKGSRRTCDRFVVDGFVSINGTVVRNPAHRLETGDRVRYLGETVSTPVPFIALLNKPVGYETTMGERRGVRTVIELLAGIPQGAAPVGRLDLRTGGLLLFSNDGDLIHRLTHPRWKIEREYLLILSRAPSERALERLRKGVMIDPGVFSRPEDIVICGKQKIRLVLTTGRNHEVRKLAKTCRLYLSGLERIRYGPVRIGSLKRGSWRFLSENEQNELRKAVGLDLAGE
jgi:pseudouridine synthase